MPTTATTAETAPTTAGSLTQLPTAARPACPVCGGRRVTTLAMTLTDGTPVDFASCHTCEHKTWSAGGHALPLATVLERSRKRPKA